MRRFGCSSQICHRGNRGGISREDMMNVCVKVVVVVDTKALSLLDGWEFSSTEPEWAARSFVTAMFGDAASDMASGHPDNGRPVYLGYEVSVDEECDACEREYESDDRECCGGRGCEVCEVYGG